MEVESAASGAADLLMECEEEEQVLWSQTPQRGKDDEEEDDEFKQGLEAAVHPLQETDSPPVRIIPIPVQPVSSRSPPTLTGTVKPSGASLGFMVNGQLVRLLPGGRGAELKLRSYPGGSASGFTTVQVPMTLIVHNSTGTHHINTTASLTATSNTPPSTPAAAPPHPAPEAERTPIITGVVSGEAAQKVLSDHSVNFKSGPHLVGLKTPTRASPLTEAPSNSSSRPVACPKLLRKGELGPVSPPDCLVCMSQYKLITELRGFMCLCSPVIAQSLRNLKRKSRYHRRSRDKNKTSKSSRDPQTSSKVTKTRPVPPARTHRPSDDFLSDQFISPTPPPTISIQHQNQSGPPPEPFHGKLVILVEDFYYGLAPGRKSIKPSVPDRRFTGPYRCIHCPRTLHNNIKLMCHMQQHVLTMSEQDRENSLSSCPQCFRHFPSPFKLQCHLETVHSLYESTATCKICELNFGSEPAFLWHMKSTHKPGEMPYVCQVCDFRSSFYSDVWSHFQEAHAETKYLLCRYCLRVLRSNTCYQQHFARHQKKHVFGCDKCRLHFLYAKERIEHNVLHHRTHIRPPQLTGLRPGTKVTVRTYSVAGGSENEGRQKKTVAPCKVVDVEPPPPTQEAPKRKPVESLGPLLAQLSQDSEVVCVSRPSQRCIECLSSVQDFRSHFPSRVRCSLCRFITCCSTSYANHMINNHATCRKNPQYQAIFQSHPRLSQRLKCVSCTFSTSSGDVMATHVSERPQHECIMLTPSEPSVAGAQPTLSCDSLPPPGAPGGGAFIPIHLLPSGQAQAQLSVKPLTSLSPLSSPPAMTIKILGPHPQPEQPAASPLSLPQLSAVLSALCHGLSQASRWQRTSPLVIRSWIEQQERGLSDRKWCWRTDKMAEWVFYQREQQLVVSEDVLLQTASRALGEGSQQLDWYSWTVDFMLRHELSLHSSNQQRCRSRLPRTIRENSHTFICSLCSKIQSKALPLTCVGSLDELSIFINVEMFNTQNPAAFQLFGSSEDRPLFDVVLSSLSDGTFLPPLLFFRGALLQVPEGFPGNILLEARQEGFSEEERLQIWITKVWIPHVAVCQRLSLLIADVHRGHLTDAFRSSLSSVSTDVVFIPSGCSCRLQPFDVCVMPVLRDFLQARWTQLVSQGGLDGLGLDQLALTLACWLSEVSSTLNSEKDFLCRSFSMVCNLKQLEDRREAARMITALTEALIQPLETPEQLEVLMVMEEGKQEEMEQEDKEEDSVKSPTALCLVFDSDSDQESFHGFQDTEMDI